MAEHKLPVIWSPEALDDVNRLGTTTPKRRELERLTESCVRSGRPSRSLTTFPSPVGRDEIRTGLRSLAAAPQIVFYRLKDDRPEIVRVLDGRQDIEAIFSDDEGG